MSVIPRPGWVASRLGRYGHPQLLAVLTAGVLWQNHSTPQILREGDTCAFFTELAECWDPIQRMSEIFTENIERFPYLGEALAPITGWMLMPTPARSEAARKIAEGLADVDLMTMSRMFCPGGILPEIHNELVTIAKRRRWPTEYDRVENYVIVAIAERLAHREKFRPDMVVGDLACGGGARLLGAAFAAAMTGVDPASMVFRGADSDPMAIAITAVALACYGLPNAVLQVGGPGELPREPLIDVLLMDMTEAFEREFGHPVDLDNLLAHEQVAYTLTRALEAGAPDGWEVCEPQLSE